jgi:oxygen-dependent protoporphyrinogen oxidase
MVVIIGGGISGLSTAWFLHKQGIDVRVLEAANIVGGVITSKQTDGYLVEGGPNSTLRKPGTDEDALGRLVESAGFMDRMVEAGNAGKKRFVMRDGRIQALPTSPPAFLATPLFSLTSKLRLLREPFISPAQTEETIAQFVERRLGREFLDYAIEPFVSGVYAGDTKELSVRAAVPKIYGLEEEYGSLIKGAIARGKAAKGAGMPQGQMVSFDGGMKVLPTSIAAALPKDACRTGCQVTQLKKTDTGWEITWHSETDSGVEVAQTVVMATPAKETADLLHGLSPAAAEVLQSISYAGIASVALGYDRDQVKHPLDGFGFLVPRKENLRVLGGLFSSSLFLERAPENKVLVTSYIGGAMDPDVVDLSESDLISQVGNDLARALEIQGDPDFCQISRHKRAIPQYTIGHLQRLAKLDDAMKALPGIELQASWRGGISVADCIKNSEALALRLAS